MKFCNICDNYLFMKLDDENKLEYFCKSCNNTIASTQNESVCVLGNEYVDDDTKYKQYMTKYIKFDPTLPRVKNIPCPNKQCTKPKDEDNVVAFIKYDFDNMRYMYNCGYCGHFWKHT